MLDRFHAHTFYGLGGAAFGGGVRDIDELIDKLPPVPDNNVWIWQKFATVSRIIINDIKEKGPCPVILGGHSYGVLSAIRVARELEKAKIKVDYLYAIDPTAGRSQAKEMVLYNNIKDVDEFWATTGIPAAARRRSKFKEGCLTVPDKWVGTYHVHIIPGGHLHCAKAEKTHKVVLDKIEAIIV